VKEKVAEVVLDGCLGEAATDQQPQRGASSKQSASPTGVEHQNNSKGILCVEAVLCDCDGIVQFYSRSSKFFVWS
jgi:DUF438 domain-containing protein